jgi:hypothetical protein
MNIEVSFYHAKGIKTTDYELKTKTTKPGILSQALFLLT